jgi:hypothetical protein
MLPRRVKPREGSVRELWTQRLGDQMLGRKVESLVQCLLPDAPEGGRWARLGQPPVERGTGRVVLPIPCRRRDRAAITTADVGEGSDLEKEPTGIELMQGGAGVTGLEKACHKEFVALTLELETRCTLIELDPECTCELPSAREPGARGNLLERSIGMGEEGATETNFEFQLFE